MRHLLASLSACHSAIVNAAAVIVAVFNVAVMAVSIPILVVVIVAVIFNLEAAGVLVQAKEAVT